MSYFIVENGKMGQSSHQSALCSKAVVLEAERVLELIMDCRFQCQSTGVSNKIPAVADAAHLKTTLREA